MVAVQEYEQLGLRLGDNHTYLKAAEEKFCSFTRGYDEAQTQQEAVTEDAVTEDVTVPLSSPQD